MVFPKTGSTVSGLPYESSTFGDRIGWQRGSTAGSRVGRETRDLQHLESRKGRLSKELGFGEVIDLSDETFVAKTFPLAEASDTLRYLVESRPFKDRPHYQTALMYRDSGVPINLTSRNPKTGL